MKLAHSLGISHRRLMGWQGAETVSHEYDDGGRLIRSAVERESEWSPYERALMVAFQNLVSQTGTHGHLMRDALDPDVRWSAEAVKDHAQAAIDRMRDQYRTDYPEDPLHGVFFVAQKQ